MSSPRSGGDAWEGPLELPGAGEVAVLYPDLCFASLDRVSAVEAGTFAAAATAARAGAKVDPEFPLASLIVSADGEERFHPDLSIREPFELQTYADGRLALEIEFVGLDVRESGPHWEAIEAVLGEWADARGIGLVEVRNDRGRSLADVWNARFELPDERLAIADVVALARRAIEVAELHAGGTVTVERMLAALRRGDAQALLRIATSPTLILRAGLSLAERDDRFRLAADVCASANSATGGIVVFGLDVDEDGRPSVRDAGPDDGDRVIAAIAETVYPAPDGVTTELVDAGDPQDPRRLRVVLVPRQDRVLKPFLVHGGGAADGIVSEFIGLAERRGADVHLDGIASLHAAIAAGRALLRGSSGATGWSHRKEEEEER